MGDQPNMFEFAVRNKLRFASERGLLSVEQLWDVPLRSRDGFNLDNVAKAVSRELKSIGEESFVDTGNNPKKTQLEICFELVKHVISTKLSDEENARKRAANKVEKERLLAILAEKQAGEMSALTIKELQDRINALET